MDNNTYFDPYQKINENNVIKNIIAGKPNWMIESNHGFKDIHEYRLFLSMLYKAYDGADITKPFEVDIGFIISGKSGEEYECLKEACENIMSRVVNLLPADEKGFSLRHLVRKADYKELAGSGKLKVAFDEDVIPFIQAMYKDGKYTKIFLKHALPIRSLYSVRLYELLLQYKKFGKRDIEISDLRFYLDIPKDKFKQWVHLKQRILIPAQSNLEKYTDIKFEFFAIKTGIKITKVHFNIFPNNPSYDSIQTEIFEEEKNEEEKTKNIVKKDIKKIPKHEMIVRENLFPESQEEALEKFSPERIMHYYSYAKQMEREGKIKGSFKGFLYISLFEDKDNFEFKQSQKEKERVIQAKNESTTVKEKEFEEEEYNRKYLEAKEKFDRLSEAEQLKYLEKIPKVVPTQTRIDAAIMLFAGIK